MGWVSSHRFQAGSGTDAETSREGIGKRFGTAIRMPPAAFADRVTCRWIDGRVDDNVVVAGWAHTGGHVVEPHFIASPPGNNVIGARKVTAHAESAHDVAIFGVES